MCPLVLNKVLDGCKTALVGIAFKRLLPSMSPLVCGKAIGLRDLLFTYIALILSALIVAVEPSGLHGVVVVGLAPNFRVYVDKLYYQDSGVARTSCTVGDE